MDPHASSEQRSLAAPGIILGAGLGGFVDGIVLHQVLQWHHLLTSTDSDNVGIPTYPPGTVHGLEMNTLWDGIFHVVTWLLVLTGMAMLFNRVQHGRGRTWRLRILWPWIIVGWGVFNVVEGLLSHQILGIHHVREGENELAWDLAFLALGVLLIVVGWWFARRASRREPATRG
ncbi:DUF2243 domain-containing protein [Aeromicrobium sp.]|uniref:DUF2243 domain-containing protein n=1 Tax=Aeromicrobium sp. TaxID=1871063 RepID=UPI0028A5DBFF|nr:DUF2243 domain-containing protein [Aeromicrobium sp.]